MQRSLFNVDTRQVDDQQNETATTTEMKRALSSHLPRNFWVGFEVKSGPSWGLNRNKPEKLRGLDGHGSVHIFDSVAIKKSWSNPEIRIYEIKQSRSDFTGDKKWEMYMDYCHKFYFVCPKDMIEPHEIPEKVGLIYHSENYEKPLHNRIGATKRSIDLPYSLFYYVIMNKLNPDRYPFFVKEKFYEQFQEYIDDERSMGRLLSRDLPEYVQELREERDDLKNEIERLKPKAKNFETIQDLFKEEADIRLSTSTYADNEKKLRESLWVLPNPEDEDNYDA